MLAHGEAQPGIVDVSTRVALARAGEFGKLGAEDAATLAEAHRLLTDMTQMLRLTVPGAFDPATAASGVKRRIAVACQLPDFEALAAALEDARADVRAIYARILS